MKPHVAPGQIWRYTSDGVSARYLIYEWFRQDNIFVSIVILEDSSDELYHGWAKRIRSYAVSCFRSNHWEYCGSFIIEEILL